MKIKVTVEMYKCNKCGHIWDPKNKERLPRMCPKCKSVKWNDQKGE